MENDSFHQRVYILPRVRREPMKGGTKRGEVRMKEKIEIVIPQNSVFTLIKHTLYYLHSLVISLIYVHPLNKLCQVYSAPKIHDSIG